jgi:RNA polymerase sigma-70 factor (ECF subfamily)
LAIGVDQATRSRRRLRWALVADPVETAAPDAFGEPDIRIALGRLSRRQRLSVECVYFVGLSVRETAAVMNCAEGTVKSTLADARAKLRTLLKVTG